MLPEPGNNYMKVWSMKKYSKERFVEVLGILYRSHVLNCDVDEAWYLTQPSISDETNSNQRSGKLITSEILDLIRKRDPTWPDSEEQIFNQILKVILTVETREDTKWIRL